MANVAGMCTSFKKELLTGTHAFGPGTGVPTRAVATTPDAVWAALYLTTASRTVADTIYDTTGELAGTGNYTQGGIQVTMASVPTNDGTQGIFTPSASLVWAALTSSGTFNCVLFYNKTQGNKAISVHTFGDQSITAGTFTLTMPAHGQNTALIQIR